MSDFKMGQSLPEIEALNGPDNVLAARPRDLPKGEELYETVGPDGVTRAADGGPPQNPDEVTRKWFSEQDDRKKAEAEAKVRAQTMQFQGDVMGAMIDKLVANRQAVQSVPPSDPTSRALDAADQAPKSTATPKK